MAEIHPGYRPIVVKLTDVEPTSGPRGIRIATISETDRDVVPVRAAACDVIYGPPASGAAHPAIVEVDDPSAAAAELVQKCRDHCAAATVLAQVLRSGASADTVSAFDIESWAYSMLLGGDAFGAWLARREPRPPDPARDDLVVAHRHGDVVQIVLNRPERRNAYSAALRDQLGAALDVAALDDSVESVEIRAAGPAFCAGGDLAEFGTTPDPVTAHFLRTAVGAGPRLAALTVPVTAYLHGACVGAGIEIPAFADRVVADPSTTILLPEIGMGLIPGAGGTVGLPRRIGRWRTFHLVAGAVVLDAPTALAWGLIDDLAEVSPATG
ncbi:MAG: enoyl-CoA hydratase/isomerase family protein [Gordonia sp. (in: high G+C Gram-positive bacteria)]